MPSLKGTETEQNLKDAFAGESQANRRYLYFAQKAYVEGYNDVSSVFRSTAAGETGVWSFQGGSNPAGVIIDDTSAATTVITLPEGSAGTSTLGLAFGGYVSSVSNATEEFTDTTSAAEAADISFD